MVVRLQEKADARIDLEAGRIDLDTYYKIAGYEDTSTIRKGVLKDMVKHAPEVLAEMVTVAMREEGFEELADRREAQAGQPPATGLLGPDGRPIPAQRPPVAPSRPFMARRPTNGSGRMR